MKDSDRYLKIVQWSEEDQCYVGMCPGFFYGGVHGDDELEVYKELCEVVDEWVEHYHETGKPLPPQTTPPTPSATETWLLAGKPRQKTPVDRRLYQLLAQGMVGEVAEPQFSYADDIDDDRAELASLIRDDVQPWAKLARFGDSEDARSEMKQRILRHLKAARYRREDAMRLVPEIVEILAN